MATAYLC